MVGVGLHIALYIYCPHDLKVIWLLYNQHKQISVVSINLLDFELRISLLASYGR